MSPKHHWWVAISYQPVHINPKEDGTLDVFSSSEEAAELASEDSVILCWLCDVPLSTENHDDWCSFVEEGTLEN